LTIPVFDDFCHANDPHEEHDFGSFEADGHRIFFKIDYLDHSMSMHSPDPADPSVTQRVITIMLAEEYDDCDAPRCEPLADCIPFIGGVRCSARPARRRIRPGRNSGQRSIP
jgi:hypothetical protein